ncbi:unnamed protein product [marine sediment metagenome]|uniref:Large polyvalent protein associated domain-containing protein n=1 Tax=marine sediment metagenome TaxID=412755 RepID=X0TCK1_9ZZZZ
MSEYVAVTETAKLIRKALRESFPGVKFSVRSEKYAGGASINIGWTDGPTTPQVEHVAGAFEGSYFDGMIDYKGSRFHKLDGERVHFMADYIFCNRHHTDRAICSAIIAAAMEYGTKNLPTVEDFKQGDCLSRGPMSDEHETFWSWSNIIHRTMEEQDRYGKPREEPPAVTPQPSKTLARVEFDGSDNYSHSQTSVAIHEVRGPAQ